MLEVWRSTQCSLRPISHGSPWVFRLNKGLCKNWVRTLESGVSLVDSEWYLLAQLPLNSTWSWAPSKIPEDHRGFHYNKPRVQITSRYALQLGQIMAFLFQQAPTERCGGFSKIRITDISNRPSTGSEQTGPKTWSKHLWTVGMLGKALNFIVQAHLCWNMG